MRVAVPKGAAVAHPSAPTVRSIRPALAALLLAVLAAPGAARAQPLPAEAPDLGRPVAERPLHRQRLNMFRLARPRDHLVVMLGDSLTGLAQWSEITGCGNVYNRGIGGDRSDEVLSRLDEVIGLRPAKVFLLVGVNDLIQHVDPQVVAANVREIVRRLRQSGAAVVVTALPPVVRAFRPAINPAIRDLNTALAAIAREQGAGFLDFRRRLATVDDALNGAYTVDGLHLNARGYEIWRDALAPELAGTCD